MALAITRNRKRGGSILLTHTGRADIQWLQDYIDTMLCWTNNDDVTLKPASLTVALNG